MLGDLALRHEGAPAGTWCSGLKEQLTRFDTVALSILHVSLLRQLRGFAAKAINSNSGREDLSPQVAQDVGFSVLVSTSGSRSSAGLRHSLQVHREPTWVYDTTGSTWMVYDISWA